MDHPVSNGLLRVNLQAIKRISGANYPRLLEQAGLQRYATDLPPVDDNPACTADEYSRLPAGVFAMLGEPLTRLFLRNAGTAMVERTLLDPRMAALAQHIAGLPPEARLGTFISHLARIVDRTWAPTASAEDAEAYYIITTNCSTCRRLRNLTAPVCATSEALYAGQAHSVLGRRIHVAEVECLATGGAACRFAFYK